MVVDIITDDFESVYEIQDDLGRFVHRFCFTLSFVDDRYAQSGHETRKVEMKTVYFLWRLFE
jgi:hypothetical protein